MGKYGKKRKLTRTQIEVIGILRRGGWISARKNGKITYRLFNADNAFVRRIQGKTFKAVAFRLKYHKEGRSSKNKDFVIWRDRDYDY